MPDSQKRYILYINPFGDTWCQTSRASQDRLQGEVAQATGAQAPKFHGILGLGLNLRNFLMLNRLIVFDTSMQCIFPTEQIHCIYFDWFHYFIFFCGDP